MIEADPTLAGTPPRSPTWMWQNPPAAIRWLTPATDTPLARLKPIPQTDRFELFYWSLVRERWRTFGDFGRLSLTLDRAHEIFRNEAVFYIQGRR